MLLFLVTHHASTRAHRSACHCPAIKSSFKDYHLWNLVHQSFINRCCVQMVTQNLCTYGATNLQGPSLTVCHLQPLLGPSWKMVQMLQRRVLSMDYISFTSDKKQHFMIHALFLLAQKKTHFLYLALGTMENNSLFALDFLEQFRELFLESCTCKMHRACYMTIQIPFSIPSKHHSPLIIRLPNLQIVWHFCNWKKHKKAHHIKHDVIRP